MEELLVTIAKGLVEDKDAVSVTADAPDEEGMVVYHLHVYPFCDESCRHPPGYQNSGRNRLVFAYKGRKGL